MIFEQVNQVSCWNVDLKINKKYNYICSNVGLKYEDILSPDWGRVQQGGNRGVSFLFGTSLLHFKLVESLTRVKPSMSPGKPIIRVNNLSN